MSVVMHIKGEATEIGDGSNTKLKSYADRIERLEIEKRERAEDISEVFKESKAAGLENDALRELVKHRLETSKQRDKRLKKAETLDMYKAALGELSDSPLGQAAIAARQRN